MLFCLLILYLNYRGLFPSYTEAWSRYEFDPGSYPEEVLAIDESLAYSHGTFIVGEDMPEGEYRLVPMSNAERNRVSLYENESERHSIASIAVEQPSRLTLKEGNKVEISQEVVAVPVEEIDEVDLKDTSSVIEEGFYEVGKDIEPGTYTFFIDSNYGYEALETYSSSYPSPENRLERIGYFPDLQTEITVEEGQWLKLDGAYLLEEDVQTNWNNANSEE